MPWGRPPQQARNVDPRDPRPDGGAWLENEALPIRPDREEWVRIEPLLPEPSWRGRKPEVDLREVLNAIRYMARSAGGWRMLPVHFGPWQTVYRWFRRFVRRLLFRTIHDVALMLDREAAGREASPSGGVLDSQTVMAPFAEVRGFDGGKGIVCRKRHVAVDTDGRC
jgi:putative transposase